MSTSVPSTRLVLLFQLMVTSFEQASRDQIQGPRNCTLMQYSLFEYGIFVIPVQSGTSSANDVKHIQRFCDFYLSTCIIISLQWEFNVLWYCFGQVPSSE